ncbi:helix-turn-helix transcriptional regulator [Pseudochelatococcus sp.]|jgi:AraC-like DNA-binding protein|uniref:helix-turn-helix transcriptional regulator n=1 Tax=Pseudochelatococcus sp. TaxID=2020869 RepID=UPI003D89CDFC
MYDRSLMYKPAGISLASMPRQTCAQAMRQYFAGSFNAREFEQLQETVLDADIAMVPLPGAGVEFGEICGAAVRWQASSSPGRRDGVMFVTGSSGFLHESDGCERRRFGPEEVLVATFGSAPRIAFDRHGLMRAVWVDRRRLQALLPGVDLARPRSIPANGCGPEMLFDYAGALVREAPLRSPLPGVAAAHLIELAALVLKAADATALAAGEGGARAARLVAIRDDIAGMFRLPAFSLTMVAEKHGISPRYVQALFEESGTTFTEYVRKLRLELARHRLSDPAHRRVRISEIAFEAGFSDLSNFNRLFRRHFGDSPSGIRARHRHEAREASGARRLSGSGGE